VEGVEQMIKRLICKMLGVKSKEEIEQAILSLRRGAREKSQAIDSYAYYNVGKINGLEWVINGVEEKI
jgi:hypothetical protein